MAVQAIAAGAIVVIAGFTGALALAGASGSPISQETLATSFDGATPVLLTTIPVGEGPWPITLDESNGQLYVPNAETCSLSIINGSSNQVATTLTLLGLGHTFCNPITPTIDPATQDLFVPGWFVTDPVYCGIAVVSASQNQQLLTLPAGSACPSTPVFDPLTGALYFSDTDSGSVTAINGDNPAEGGTTIPVGYDPQPPVFDSLTGDIYVANYGSNNVTVINASSNTTVANISGIPCPSEPAVDTSTGNLYLNTCGSSVFVINSTTESIQSTVGVGYNGNHDLFFNPTNDASNNNVYVPNYVSDTLSVINASSNTEVEEIPVGSGPLSPLVDAQSGYLYVANTASNTITVVDGFDNTVVDTISVGNAPYPPTFDPLNGDVYVPNFGSGTVSVIAGTLPTPNTYPIEFTEEGLVPGTTWSVVLGGEPLNSTNSVIFFSEANGSYPFAIGSVSGYVANLSSGTITVSGAAVSNAVTFTPSTPGGTLYAVTFSESGLPFGSEWSVELNGYTQNSNTATIGFTETEGDLPYTVFAVENYNPTPQQSTVDVSGAATGVDITFAEASTNQLDAVFGYSTYWLPTDGNGSVSLGIQSEGVETSYQISFQDCVYSGIVPQACTPNWISAENPTGSVPAYSGCGYSGEPACNPACPDPLYEACVSTLLNLDGTMMKDGTYSVEVLIESGVGDWTGTLTVLVQDLPSSSTIPNVNVNVQLSRSSESTDYNLVVELTPSDSGATPYVMLSSPEMSGFISSLEASFTSAGFVFPPRSSEPGYVATLPSDVVNTNEIAILNEVLDASQLGDLTIDVLNNGGGLMGVTDYAEYLANNQIPSPDELVSEAVNNMFTTLSGSVEQCLLDYHDSSLPTNLCPNGEGPPIYEAGSPYNPAYVAGAGQKIVVEFSGIMPPSTLPSSFMVNLQGSNAWVAGVDGLPPLGECGSTTTPVAVCANTGLLSLQLALTTGCWISAWCSWSYSAAGSVQDPLTPYLTLAAQGVSFTNVSLDPATRLVTGNVTVDRSRPASGGYPVDMFLPAMIDRTNSSAFAALFDGTPVSVSTLVVANGYWANWTAPSNGSFEILTPPQAPVLSLVCRQGEFMAEGSGFGGGVSLNVSAFSGGVWSQLGTVTSREDGTILYESATVPAADGAEVFVTASNQQFSATASCSVPPLNEVPPFLVDFTESGLPAKTLARHGWMVELDGMAVHATTTQISFAGTRELANGTYPVLITGPSGYQATGSGTVTVSGVTSVPVSMTKGKTYSLSFGEKGLPKSPKQPWCIEVAGDEQCTTATSLQWANLSAGTYAYGVVSPLTGQNITQKVGSRTLHSPNGTITLGKSTTVTLTFTYRYSVKFVETGLPSGSWSVMLKGLTRSNGTGDPITFAEPNGTYSYKVTPPSGTSVTPKTSRVYVDNASQTVYIRSYLVIFSETGLPNGTSWSITINGKTVSNKTFDLKGTVVFYEGNGTYGYKIAAITGYTSAGSPRRVTVSGPGSNVTVTFTKKIMHGGGSPFSFAEVPLLWGAIPGAVGRRTRRV